MKKRIYVNDILHTVPIISNLQKFLKRDFEIAKLLDNGQGDKFDFFFLGAKDVLNGIHSVPDLKRRYGNPEARAIAISVEPKHLDEVKRRLDIGIDHVLDKIVLLGDVVSEHRLRPGSSGTTLSEILGLSSKSQ